MLNIKRRMPETYNIPYVYEQKYSDLHLYIYAVVNSDDLINFSKRKVGIFASWSE